MNPRSDIDYSESGQKLITVSYNNVIAAFAFLSMVKLNVLALFVAPSTNERS